MRRYGRCVDARWIHQRMNQADARFARTGRSVASSYAPTSLPPAKYLIGDLVEVTNGARVGEREVVLARGVIDAVTGEYPDQSYAVHGVEEYQRARTLRLVLRGGGR